MTTMEIYIRNEAKRFSPNVIEYDCECCGRKIRAQKRVLNDKLCKFMLMLNSYHKEGVKYVHYNEVQKLTLSTFNINVTDYACLFHFMLIENNPENKGYLRISKSGEEFMNNELKVSEYYYQIPGTERCIFTRERVSIEDILRKKYNKNL